MKVSLKVALFSTALALPLFASPTVAAADDTPAVETTEAIIVTGTRRENRNL